MMKLPEFQGVAPSINRPTALPNHMNDALALVREGRLQEATEMLMGHSQPPANPAAPQTDRRFSNVLARGIDGVQDVLAKDARRPAPAPLASSPHAASAAPSATANPPGPQARATATHTEEPGRFERVAFTHSGISHTYWLYTPQAAAPADGRPLVMMLHGCTQDARDFARGTRMNAVAETAGALVLYPTQSPRANANGCWNWFRPEDQKAGAGEPALLLAMVEHAMATQAVDRRRVYVAGLSAGGAMAAVLAQEHPEVFAAAGVHSGLVPGAAKNMMGALSAMKSGAKGWSAPAPKAGARPVPMIVMHGDADRTVHQRNGEQLFQGAANGAATSVQTQEQGASADGHRYTRTSVVDPAAQGAVVAEHWLLHGAGHAWSGGDARGSYANAHGVDASAQMLRFFLSHPGAGAATGA
jgi:poly(hydroxyalkanoate) depolymerase family esterase